MHRTNPRTAFVLFISIIGLVLAATARPGSAADIFWTNPVSGDWGDLSKWNAGAGPVPGPGDVAHITADGTYTVTMSSDRTVASLDLGAASGQQSLELQGPGTGGSFTTLTLTGASTVNANGRLWFTGGARVVGTGSLAMSGTVHGGYYSWISVPMTTTASSFITVQGGNLTVASGFTNQGTIELTNTEPPHLEPMLEVMGTLVNAPGATIVARSGIGIYNERYLRAVLDNQGSLIVEGPNQVGAIPLLKLWNHAVDSDNLNSAVITLDGDFTVLHPGGPVNKTFTNTGTITVAAGRTFRVNQGVLNQNAGSITGAGTLALTGSVTGNLNTPLAVSALTLDGSAAILTSDLSTATTSLAMLHSSLDGPVTVTNAPGVTTTLLGNNTIYTKLHNAGTLIAEGIINGEFTTATGSVLRVDGTLNLPNGLTNLGTLQISRNAQLVLAAATLVNAPGAILKTQDVDSDMAYLVGRLVNQGTLNVNSKLTLDRAQAHHVNSGSIHVIGANFLSRQWAAGSFTNSGTITVAAGRKYESTEGTFTNAPTGQLLGAGTYDFGATLVNQGTIAPGTSPGILSITGDASFSNGTLDVELGGLTVGTQFDQLAVSGTAALDGKLRITLLDGFCAAPGDQFRILNAGSRTGTFGTVEILGHGNALFDVQYDGTGVTLSTQSNLLTVNAGAGPHGGISPSGGVQVACGGSQAFTITPADCYHIADVLVDGVSVGSVSNHTINGVIDDHTISATFAIDTYTIGASAGENGSVTPSGSTIVDCGSPLVVTITPAFCYHVADVLVDGVSVGPVTQYTFTDVRADHTIVASFALDSRTITASAGDNGSIDPNGPVVVPCGSNQSFAMIPSPGYGVGDVLVDGVSVGAVATYDFTNVVTERTIAVSFVDVAPPVVTVLYPNGGDEWIGTQTRVIHWTATDNVAVDSVDVDYSLHGEGGPWVNILRSSTPVDSAVWEIPNECSDSALVRVTAYDAQNNGGPDRSDAHFRVVCGTLGAKNPIPTSLALHIPNPVYAGPVRMRLSLPAAASATLDIVAVTGQKVWSTRLGGSAGVHEVSWNGRADDASVVAPGVYFARLQTPLGGRTVRFVMLR